MVVVFGLYCYNSNSSGENSTECCWGLSSGASFKTWRTLFCILYNNAVVQQRPAGMLGCFLWFLSLQTEELINFACLQCKLLTEKKFSSLHRATFSPCAVQGCKYFPSKSLLFPFTLHSVTMLISVMGRFCMVGAKRGPSLGCVLLPALSCIVKWTLSCSIRHFSPKYVMTSSCLAQCLYFSACVCISRPCNLCEIGVQDSTDFCWSFWTEL